MAYLRADVRRFLGGDNLFERLWSMDSTVHRAVGARKTVSFQLGGNTYYAKLHGGVGWLEIVKNWAQFKRPVLGARNEWEAIAKVRSLGVGTLTVVAFGEEGWNPARSRSLIVTEAIEDAESLEDYCGEWLRCPPPVTFRRKLISEVARISRTIHDAGLNHRDYYICHFLMPKACRTEPELYLIDLHRAEIRPSIPYRWRVKDVAGLFFSAFDIGLTRGDLARFVAEYADKPLARTLREDAPFWRDVVRRAGKEYLKTSDRLPAWYLKLSADLGL